MSNGISIGPAVFAGYLVVTSQTDRQTDRQTDHGNVSSNRPHLYATHIRCGLIIFAFLCRDAIHRLPAISYKAWKLSPTQFKHPTPRNVVDGFNFRRIGMQCGLDINLVVHNRSAFVSVCSCAPCSTVQVTRNAPLLVSSSTA